MNILVNFQQNKDGSVTLKEYQENGKVVVLFDLGRIGILSTETDLSQPLTLVSTDKLPFPIVITVDEAKELIEYKKQLNEQIGVSGVVIEAGEEQAN